MKYVAIAALVLSACGAAPEDVDYETTGQDVKLAVSTPLSQPELIHGAVNSPHGLRACVTNDHSSPINCGNAVIFAPRSPAHNVCVPDSSVRAFMQQAYNDMLSAGFSSSLFGASFHGGTCLPTDDQINVGAVSNDFSGYDLRNFSTGGCSSADFGIGVGFGGNVYTVAPCFRYAYTVDLAELAADSSSLKRVARNVLGQIAGLGGETNTGSAMAWNFPTGKPSSTVFRTWSSGQICRHNSSSGGPNPSTMVSTSCANN